MSWTVKGKDKRNWYVTVSGGYVIFGCWITGEPLSTKDTHCNMEQFLAGQFHSEIKEVRIASRRISCRLPDYPAHG